MKLRNGFLIVVFLLSGLIANAQSDELDDIELEVKKKPKQTKALEKDEFLQNAETLNKLAAFSDLAVIQKRYLPKTQRFQAHLGLNQIQNNPYFSTGGVHAKFGFFLNEEWGLEFKYLKISSTKKSLSVDLSQFQGVKTSTLVSPESYMGLDLVYVPIYGKIGWMNQKIIPFDLFFAVGAGQTTTSYKSTQASTIHLGTGQIFALSKSMAFRWDFDWNIYSSSAEKISGGVSTGKTVTQNFNDLYLGAGFSWFFPEAKYR